MVHQCVQHVRAQVVAKLHIETFVAFDFDSSLISGLIQTPIWTELNEFFDNNWCIIIV